MTVVRRPRVSSAVAASVRPPDRVALRKGPPAAAYTTPRAVVVDGITCMTAYIAAVPAVVVAVAVVPVRALGVMVTPVRRHGQEKRAEREQLDVLAAHVIVVGLWLSELSFHSEVCCALLVDY